jgi:homoserine O-succinyltransferase
MTDDALEATERQFLSLLNAASGRMEARLSLYSLPGIARKSSLADHVSTLYSDFASLRNHQLDALIVTGREPMKADLAEEDYWGNFTLLLDWARENTYSVIWSGLAAHAAVQYTDGIRRVKSAEKYCGVFECEAISDHALIAGVPQHYTLPHSRWNGLQEDMLIRSGYSVLTRAKAAGIDMFAKSMPSLFVYFQGHPEYESDTLLCEYRRDIGRYFKVEAEKYPTIPGNYFDESVVASLNELRNTANNRAGEKGLEEVSECLSRGKVRNTWRSTATSIYGNWLRFIWMKKSIDADRDLVLAESLAEPLVGVAV